MKLIIFICFLFLTHYLNEVQCLRHLRSFAKPRGLGFGASNPIIIGDAIIVEAATSKYNKDETSNFVSLYEDIQSANNKFSLNEKIKELPKVNNNNNRLLDEIEKLSRELTTESNYNDETTIIYRNEALEFSSDERAEITTEQPQAPQDGSVAYPWLAGIMKNKKQICTGTLIDERHILTTAYCLFNLSPDDLFEIEIDIGYKTSSSLPAAVRQFDLNQCAFVTVKVAKTIRHLRFNPSTAYNDIGLIQLVAPVQFNEFVRPIQLAQTAKDERGDENLHVVGWRDGEDLNGDYVPFWRDERIRHVEREECRRDYSDYLAHAGISDDMMCAGGSTEATACRWKFGSPILDSNSTSQLGVFSWGIEAFLPECKFSPRHPTPLVFTRVSSYSNWITSNLVH